jgi:antitoxin YefM
MITRSYTQTREQLAELLNLAVNDRETIIIERRGYAPVAMIAADELSALQETVYLLRNPANARRLLTALARSQQGEGIETDIEQLEATLQLESDAQSGA